MRRRKLSHIVGTVVVLLFLFASSVIAVPFYQASNSTSAAGLCEVTLTAGSLSAYSGSIAENEAMTPVAIPEPATVALLGLGTLVLISGKRGSRKK